MLASLATVVGSNQVVTDPDVLAGRSVDLIEAPQPRLSRDYECSNAKLSGTLGFTPRQSVLAAATAVTGCSAGQVAETANIVPTILGVDAQTPDGSLLIRNLHIAYDTPAG